MPKKGQTGAKLLKGVKRVQGEAKGSAKEFVARRTGSRHKGAFVMPEEFERAKRVAESALSTADPDTPQADREAVKKSALEARQSVSQALEGVSKKASAEEVAIELEGVVGKAIDRSLAKQTTDPARASAILATMSNELDDVAKTDYQ